jgi:hypothetical protein
MYITCSIQGGLGNQLFQIYTVLSRSLEYNNAKSIFLNSKVSSEYPNTFRPTYYDSIFDKLELFDSNEDSSYNWVQLREEYTGDKECLENKLNIKLIGYFQNYNIFYKHLETINQILTIHQKIDEVYNKYKSIYELDRTKDNIAIHFRLGDYKFKQQCHPLLPLNYYINALKILNVNSNVLVFCEKDDIELVKNLMKVIQEKVNITNYTIVTDMTDEEQLLFMSNCNQIVMANSTFSWWSSLYSQSIINKENCKICIPFKWFHSLTNSGYIMKNWNIIRW